MGKGQEADKRMSVLVFLWRHSAKVKAWFVLALACALVGIAASFLMPQVIRFTVDGILGGGDSAFAPEIQRWLAGQDSRTSLLYCALFVVGFALLSGFGNFSSRLAVATGTERFSKSLRDNLFRHVQYLPFKWHVATQTGEIIQRCTADLDAVRDFVANQLLEVVRTLLLITVALVLMFSMNVKLTLVALIFIPLIVLYSVIFYRLVGSRFLAADEAEGELTSVVQENLTGVRVVRAFGRERFELERFDKYNERFAGLWIKLGHILGPYWGIGDIATGMQILSVVVVGTLFAANGQITLGEFLVFVSYNQTLAWPIRSLGRTLSEMSKAGVSAKRIQEILDAEEEKPEPGALCPPLDTDIRFENVTFSYDNQPVLQDLTFTIPKGTTFGILGATGSGKSTITYLLNRLYDLPEGFGEIYYGDVEIRKIDRRYLRKGVGLVLQEPFLFSKTIEENIAITSERPQPAHIRHSAGVAAVDEAIRSFAHGYETVVGERGVTLSGGQKQRVAIARTLMQNAPVMVFDDSMSAVDLETDAKIRQALRREKGEATIVLISHRINTLMRADQILVLEEGKIAAMGCHEELIKKPGLYKRIYDMQNEAAHDETKERDEDRGT
ncbi:ABC transporter ATP-binding protein/permease [Ruminococcaceae bacterium OttesenSCG-928-I18]|nr:ABC transporter ATP-binding protein/permease [Ruminococcaceae bacterium OttesenSCG-928-I18]